MEPPVSEPKPAAAKPAATAAAEPPEEPPGTRLVSSGFFVVLERRVLGGAAHGELVEVGLADHDRSGCHEPLDDGGVVGRAPAVEDPRRAGGRHAPGAHIVLERYRHPGERPGGLAGGDALVDGIGGGTGVVGQHRDERVDVDLVCLDAGEVLVGDLPCAAFTRADRRGDADHAVRLAARPAGP